MWPGRHPAFPSRRLVSSRAHLTPRCVSSTFPTTRTEDLKIEDTHFGFLLPNLLLMMWTPHALGLELIPRHFMPGTQFGARARSVVPAAAAGSPAVFDV